MDNNLSGVPVVELPGPILLGGFLQSFMLGIILSQGFTYWSDYRDDSRRKRLFVAIVVFLCILQTALEDYKSCRSSIHQKKWSTSNIQWSDLLLNGLISTLCEAFFIRRCWKMTKKSPWVLYALTSLLTVLTAVDVYLAIAIGVVFRTLEAGNTYTSLEATQRILTSTVVAFAFWIFGSLVLNLAITAILVVALWKSRTGLVHLDQALMKIISITLESSALPAACMLVAVGLYHPGPSLKDHLILFFVLLTGKLYTIGLLRTLNSRAHLRERMTSHDLGRTSLASWQWDKATPGSFSCNPGFLVPEPPRAFDTSDTVRSSVCSAISSTNSRDGGPPQGPAAVSMMATSVMTSLMPELRV